MKDEIVSKLTEFSNKYRDLLSKEEYFEIRRAILEISKNDSYSYEELKAIENRFAKYYARVWQESLTDFNEYDEQSNFKFLVTCPTVSADNYASKAVTSASLLSNKHLGTFNKIPVGIVLGINEDSILAVSSDDMHSVVVNSGDSMPSYFYVNTLEGKDIYAKKRVSALKTPEEVEKELMAENIRQNGNILVQGESSVYSDILLSTAETEKLGVILIEPCEEMYVEEAQKLASKLNLPLKKINRDHYCNKVGISAQVREVNNLNLYDINLIESIPARIDSISRTYNNICYVGNMLCVRDDQSDNYLLYNPFVNAIIVVIKNDTRSIHIEILEDRFIYSVDDVRISREEMQHILEEAKLQIANVGVKK